MQHTSQGFALTFSSLTPYSAFITNASYEMETHLSSLSSHSTRLLAATTLRNVLGTKNLAEILSERETISHIMQSSLDEATDPWGVKVERVEM